ncbi:MAG: EFR1 family ferrodoxin [Candidatus Omnitrophota bacterium]
MNAVIYYFSGTGNSLIVANDLAAELGSAKVIPVTKALKSGGDPSYDVVGVVYPVYMFGIPLIIASFLKTLIVKQGAYVFCVATYGGLTGRPHSLAKDILRKRAIDLAAGFSVRMPGNYTPLYGAIAQEQQERMFAKEKSKVQEIANLIRERARGIYEEKPVWLSFLFYILLYKAGSAQIPSAGRNFWVNDACTKCGICGRVCPVENIAMKDGKPVWLDHCQQCVACLQWCPVEAIQYKKSTAGRKRYRNPRITVQAIMGQR